MGLDETDRLNAGVPSYRQNSWRAGLDRLLLGYAMPDEGSLYGGILPMTILTPPLQRLSGFLLRLLMRLSDCLKG